MLLSDGCIDERMTYDNDGIMSFTQSEPLRVYRHISMLGRYAFTIPDMVARGALRPLRNPGATGIDEA